MFGFFFFMSDKNSNRFIQYTWFYATQIFIIAIEFEPGPETMEPVVMSPPKTMSRYLHQHRREELLNTLIIPTFSINKLTKPSAPACPDNGTVRKYEWHTSYDICIRHSHHIVLLHVFFCVPALQLIFTTWNRTYVIDVPYACLQGNGSNTVTITCTCYLQSINKYGQHI